MQNYIADKPLESQDEDQFGRAPFAKRIAKVIRNIDTEDCLTISINGEWGEGKSTVLNYTLNSLEKDDRIVIVKFNPWRYQSENQIIIAFFNALSQSLKDSIKSNTEKIGEVIEKYAQWITDITSLAGYDAGKIPEQLGKLLSGTSLEKQKKKLETILKKYDQRLLVVVDDIDRLNKKEIQAVFRLIKLTADFKYTIYLLSFDKEIVASAMGEIYGDDEKEDGYRFIEKIVQVPINLPTISKVALRDFLYSKISSSLSSNNIELSKVERSRLYHMFSSYFLYRLTNPRLAIRYANSITFTLPIVYKEVNTVDFMLIEALKIFYPNGYQFLKTNSKLFISSTRNRQLPSIFSYENDDLVKSQKDLFNEFLGKYEPIDKNNLRSIYGELFPILDSDILGNTRYSDYEYQKWYKHKRVGSPLYFNRYFHLSVPKDEIPDTLFGEMLRTVSISYQPEAFEPQIRVLTNENLWDSFIMKVLMVESVLGEKLSYNLSLFISIISDRFSNNIGSSGLSEIASASMALRKLISNTVDYRTRDNLFVQIIKEMSSLPLTIDLVASFTLNKRQEKISEESISEAVNLLIKRVKRLDEHILNVNKSVAGWFFELWKTYSNKIELEEYIKDFVEVDSQNIMVFIRTMMPTTSASGIAEPYKTYLGKESFNFINNLIDSDYTAKKLQLLYKDQLTGLYEKSEYMKPCTEIETANQFINLLEQFEEE